MSRMDFAEKVYFRAAIYVFPVWDTMEEVFLPCGIHHIPIVPHNGGGVAPMSSLSGVELLGLWKLGMGGLIG